MSSQEKGDNDGAQVPTTSTSTSSSMFNFRPILENRTLIRNPRKKLKTSFGKSKQLGHSFGCTQPVQLNTKPLFLTPNSSCGDNNTVLFSQPTTKSSVFSSDNAEPTKSSTFSTTYSVFGQPTTKSSVFSSNNADPTKSSTFSTTNSVFGQPATESSLFSPNNTEPTNTKSSTFGSTASNSVFGQPAQSTHTKSSSLASNSPGLFNQPTFSTCSNLFDTKTTSSVFGQNNNPKSSIFDNTSDFFSPKSTNTTSSTPVFGQPPQSIIGIGFGAPISSIKSDDTSKLCTFDFDKKEEKLKDLSKFEVSINVSPTIPVKFSPTCGTDIWIERGVTTTISTMFQCIIGMKQYSDKSLEEIRFEDYNSRGLGTIIPMYRCKNCLKEYNEELLEELLTHCVFHWEVNILNFSMDQLSPTFHPILAQDQNWQLKLQTNDNNLSLHLINLSHQDVTASFSLSLLNQKHETVQLRSRNNVTFKANGGQSGFVDFVDANLQNQILYSGKFTILCEVNPQESENLEDQSARLEEFDRFEKLLTNSEFSDVSVTSDQGKTYKLHKCVLASCSDKLKDLNEVKGVRVEVLDEFFRFVYTGRINSGILNMVVDLLTLAEKYEVEGLKKLCEDKMCKNLNEENAVEYLKLALLNKADKLRVHAISWMSQNLTSLVNKPEFRELGIEHPELLIELMKGRFGNN